MLNTALAVARASMEDMFDDSIKGDQSSEESNYSDDDSNSDNASEAEGNAKESNESNQEENKSDALENGNESSDESQEEETDGNDSDNDEECGASVPNEFSSPVQFEDTVDDESMDSVGNDVDEESGLGGNGNKEELVAGKYKKLLPNVTAAPATSSGVSQPLTFQPTLNAAYIGETLSALQRIGAVLQPTQTVLQPMLQPMLSSQDELKPPAATKNIPKAPANVKHMGKGKVILASRKMAVTSPYRLIVKKKQQLTRSPSTNSNKIKKQFTPGKKWVKKGKKSGKFHLVCHYSISFFFIIILMLLCVVRLLL